MEPVSAVPHESYLAVPMLWLVAGVCGLVVLSAFFSGSETGMMALNRYRLRHLAQEGHPGARRASKLLERPDRLIGLILLGNTFVNAAVASLATLLFLEIMGEAGLAAAPLVASVTLLLFGEVLPKTLAALHPERVAFPAAWVLAPLLRVLYPVVWVVNAIANSVLSLAGIRPDQGAGMSLSREELRTILMESGALIPRKHRQMLFGVLDLEQASVEDIMVPRSEITGIDLEDDTADIERQLMAARHTRLPVYRGNLDAIVGVLHLRKLPRLYWENAEDFTRTLESLVDEPYYVPMGTPLTTQLLNFQRHRVRVGLVVDEYGVIQGLVTLEDLLEEIVGEFTTDPMALSRDIHPQADGSFIIDGSASLRDINRSRRWHLPTQGAKTLNGLILETLESIPEPGTTLRVEGYTIEVLQATDQTVRMARVVPPAGSHAPAEG